MNLEFLFSFLERKNNLLSFLFSIPKIIFINFYYFSFRQALKFPLRISNTVTIKSLGSRTSIVLLDPTAKIYVGFGGSFGMGDKGYWDIGNNAKVIFEGDAVFSKGIKMIVHGNLKIGKCFSCNSNCIINASDSITIGSNVILGWNCKILDGDGHKIIHKKIVQLPYSPILIENHVWLTSDVTLLKGTVLRSDSVVATCACISHSFNNTNLLIGGFNKILKEGITWEK